MSNRKRDLLFTLALLFSLLANVGGAFLNYVIWSDGLIAEDLYKLLVDAVSLVTLLILVVCVGLTALAYGLSLDPERPARPRIRLWLLATSFFLFLDGFLAGRWKISPENFIAFGLLGASAALLGAGWVWVEDIAGQCAIELAKKLLEGAPAHVAWFWARIGLMLRPSNRQGQNILARALARLGRFQGAELYLEQAYADGERDADLCHALAELAEEKGDLVKAAQCYEEAHRQAPSTALFRKLIKLWEQTGQKRKALEALRKLPADERRHWADHIQELMFEVGDLQEMRELCREYERDGPPFARAKSCYSRLLASHPRDVGLMEALAELCRRNNELDEEKNLLTQMLTVRPEHAGYRRRLIEICRWQGRLDEVLAQLDTLVDLGDATPEELLEAAHEHFARAEYARVEEMLSRSPRMRSSKEAAWLLASCYFETGRVDRAKEEVRRAAQLPDDEDADVRARLISLENRIRELELKKELEALELAVDQDPENLELRFQYYDRLLANGNAERVVLGLEEIVERQPEMIPRVEAVILDLAARHERPFRLMSYLADLYLRTAQWDKVFALYRDMSSETLHGTNLLLEGVQKILQSNPTHAPSLRFAAQNAAEAGRPQEVLEYLERFLAAGGEATSDILRLEFEAFVQLGQDERAIEVGRRLLELAPSDARLATALATLLAKRDCFEEAARLISRATALDPTNPELKTMAARYEEKRRLARIEQLRASLTNDAEHDAPLHMELGDLMHDFGRLNEAIVEYQKAAFGKQLHNMACAKLGYVLAFKGLYGEAEEILEEVKLSPEQSSEENAKLKALLFRSAELFEKDNEFARALGIYKRIFRVDAGYRDVVSKIEKLQRLVK